MQLQKRAQSTIKVQNRAGDMAQETAKRDKTNIKGAKQRANSKV
jgi:hypothetical protein